METMLKDLHVLSKADAQCMRAAESLAFHGWVIENLESGVAVDLHQLPPWDECQCLFEMLSTLSPEGRRRIEEDCFTIEEVQREWKGKIFREVQRLRSLLLRNKGNELAGEGEMERRPSF
jgi:hypothetical protein